MLNLDEVVFAEAIKRWYREKPGYGLKDVMAFQEQKERLVQLADNLLFEKNDDMCSTNLPHGCILYGLPGCGKTYLIEGFVHDMMEKGCHYIHLNLADIESSFVGVDRAVLRTAFQEAISHAPSILFVDDVECIVASRKKAGTSETEGLRTALVVELLEQLRVSGKPVLFLGETRRPTEVDTEVLNNAHMVPVPLPTEEVRAAYFEKQLKVLPLAEDLSYEYMADATDNFSYRDLNRCLNAIKIQARDKAIEEYAVKDDEGNVIIEQSDESVSEALRQGKIIITREWFDQIRKDNPPDNTEEIQKELTEFEKGIANG